MARMMAVRRQMRMRRRRRRRMLLLVGGMAVLGYAGYKLSQRNVQRVEEHTGEKADELTDEQLEQAMDELGIEKETMTDEEWAEAQKADAQPSYLDELERLADLHNQGILTDEEFSAKKKDLLGL
jgi:RES domain-containing protein